MNIIYVPREYVGKKIKDKYGYWHDYSHLLYQIDRREVKRIKTAAGWIASIDPEPRIGY